MTDLLLTRYSDVNFLISLPLTEFCELVLAAAKQVQKEEIRKQWTALLPFMYMKRLKYMPFEDYFESCTGATIDRRPAEEIINEILEAHHAASLEELGHGNI